MLNKILWVSEKWMKIAVHCNGSCLQMENSNENGRHADLMWVNTQISYLSLYILTIRCCKQLMEIFY